MKTTFSLVSVCLWAALSVACASKPNAMPGKTRVSARESKKETEAQLTEGLRGEITEVERTRLSKAALSDPTQGTLDDVEAMIDSDRPVRAAEFMDIGAIPAATSHLLKLKDVGVSTRGGRDLKERLVAAYEQRLSGLKLHRAALARGAVEDLALVDAIRARRKAEEALVEVHKELSEP